MRNIIIISLLSFLVGVLTTLCFEQFTSKNNNVHPLGMQIDTVLEFIQSPPVILEKVKTKIVHTRDTIISTQPFIATVDTVVKLDTISASYEFPENLFSLNYRKKNDTLKTVIIKTDYDRSKDTWWESPAIAVAGVIAGYLIRKYSE